MADHDGNHRFFCPVEWCRESRDGDHKLSITQPYLVHVSWLSMKCLNVFGGKIEFVSGVVAEEGLLSQVVAVAGGHAVWLERSHHGLPDSLIILVLKIQDYGITANSCSTELLLVKAKRLQITSRSYPISSVIIENRKCSTQHWACHANVLVNHSKCTA